MTTEELILQELVTLNEWLVRIEPAIACIAISAAFATGLYVWRLLILSKNQRKVW